MYAYPTNVTEEIGTLLAALRSPATAANPTTIQAGWAVVGYGLSYWHGSGQRLTAFAVPDSNEDGAQEKVAVAKLEELQTALPALGVAGVHRTPVGGYIEAQAAPTAAVPILPIIQQLLPVLLALLQQWLGR